MGKLGGLAVLNLDGIHSRYENVEEVYEKIAAAPPEAATELVQKLYKEPVKEKLIAQRVKEIKAGKVNAAVSCIPQNAEKFVQDRSGSRRRSVCRANPPSPPSGTSPPNTKSSI